MGNKNSIEILRGIKINELIEQVVSNKGCKASTFDIENELNDLIFLRANEALRFIKNIDKALIEKVKNHE